MFSGFISAAETFSNRYYKPKPEPHLLGSLPGIVQLPPALHRALHQLLPAALHAEQQVLDQHHVLLLAEILQVRPRLVQLDDVVPVRVHLRHKHLGEDERNQELKQ